MSRSRTLAIAVPLVLSACSPIARSGPNTTPNATLAYSGPVRDFDTCLVSGGDVMESYPRQCSIGNEHFTEVPGPGRKGETLVRTFRVEPQTTTCQGFHPVDQQCLIVNGELFYDEIEGFKHVAGQASLIEVEQLQYCDPDTFNDCPQDVGIYRYRLVRSLAGPRP